MFFIRKQNDSEKTLSNDQHEKFLKACESYINKLQNEGKLISASPIERKGNIVSSHNKEWKISPFNESNEVIGGYYRILAKDLDEAISIAKLNPEFEFNSGTRIEVRSIKSKEDTTGYVYPSRKKEN